MTCPMAAANADWAADLARQGLKQAKEVDPKELFANMTRLAQNLPDEGGDDTWVALLAGPLQRDNSAAARREVAGEVLRREAAGTEHTWWEALQRRHCGTQGLSGNIVVPARELAPVTGSDTQFTPKLVNRVILSHPADCERIARAHVTKQPNFSPFFLKSVISTTDNRHWKAQRDALTPSMMPKASLEQIFPVSRKRAMDCVWKLDKESCNGEKRVDMAEFLLHETNAQLRLALFGDTEEEMEEVNREIRGTFGGLNPFRTRNVVKVVTTRARKFHASGTKPQESPAPAGGKQAAGTQGQGPGCPVGKNQAPNNQGQRPSCPVGRVQAPSAQGQGPSCPVGRVQAPSAQGQGPSCPVGKEQAPNNQGQRSSCPVGRVQAPSTQGQGPSCPVGKGQAPSTQAQLPARVEAPLAKALFQAGRLPGFSRADNRSAIIGNALILSFAGHDTTGLTLTWLLFELAKPENRKHREDLHREVDELWTRIRSENRTELAYADFKTLPFMTRCIVETLRLWPVVANGTYRVLETDDWVTGPDGGRVVLPKGTRVQVTNWSRHRNPALWGPTVNEFDPRREFLPQEVWGDAVFAAGNPHSKRFAPFTHPPRDCLGRNFAQMEMRAILCHILREYTFELAPPNDGYRRSGDQGGGIATVNYGTLGPRDMSYKHFVALGEAGDDATFLRIRQPIGLYLQPVRRLPGGASGGQTAKL
ncbi:putative cytochrome P450 CYP13A10 [Diplonema papillatum]|nr:putative cytochrome P450 CYP13A10 [Diplonema papillatum]